MSNRPALTASDVQKMVVACKGEATKNKWNVSIAVVDDAGYLLYLERLDGAGPVTAEVATEKAATAARTRPPHQVLGGPRQGTALVHQVPGQPADSGRRAHHVSERVRRRDRRVRGSVSRGRAICQCGGRRARLGIAAPYGIAARGEKTRGPAPSVGPRERFRPFGVLRQGRWLSLRATRISARRFCGMHEPMGWRQAGLVSP